MKLTPNNLKKMQEKICHMNHKAINDSIALADISIKLGDTKLKIPFNADTSDWLKNCLSEEILKESMLHDFLPQELKESVLDYVFIDDVCEFKVIDKHHDMILFLEYNKGVLVGLDFFMDANDTEVEFNGANTHLTEIYNRLNTKHGDYMSQYDKIHKAFDLYCTAFIHQEEEDSNTQTFSLVNSDIDLLKDGLEALKDKLNKLETEEDFLESDYLRSRHFDCFGLIGMLKESEFVDIMIPKKAIENWSASTYGVDFPSPYCDQINN